MRFVFLCTPFRHSLFSCFAVLTPDKLFKSVQDELTCVRLVIPRCMFRVQLFLSEIVKFRFDQK